MSVKRNIQPNLEDYGDLITTVDQTGKRKWIYALQPKGKWYNRRTIVAIFLIVFFASMPFIKVNGNPIMLFDIPHGRFIIFGQLFLPHDFIILGVAMLVALIFIIVFTLIFGRIFCGWICPQTIFLEMIFRRIEYWIEGPANKQRVNDKKPTTEVWIRKIIKHIIFFAISFLIANLFLSYIIGVDELYKIITEPVSEHLGGFVALLVFTFIFYAVFAFVREIVCNVICPYGRLQSILLDKSSLVVAYDYNRGEPRSKKRKTDEPIGDCIDCGLCVQVCPTGIDIRNGTQMECTNCTACIDACNMMMEKVNLPLNLITFASEKQLETKAKPGISWRAKVYSIALLGLMIVLGIMLFNRPMIDATVLKVAGQTYQEHPDDKTISNLFKIKVISKSMKTVPFAIRVQEEGARVQMIGQTIDSLKSGEVVDQSFFIFFPEEKITQRRNKIHIEIRSGDKVVQTKEVNFLGKY